MPKFYLSQIADIDRQKNNLVLPPAHFKTGDGLEGIYEINSKYLFSIKKAPRSKRTLQ